MLRLDAKLGEIWGFSPLIFVRGHFYEIGIAALLFRVKPRHVEKFRKYRFADVGKSELGKKRKKHAQNIRSTVHRTGDLMNELMKKARRDVAYIEQTSFVGRIVISNAR